MPEEGKDVFAMGGISLGACQQNEGVGGDPEDEKNGNVCGNVYRGKCAFERLVFKQA